MAMNVTNSLKEIDILFVPVKQKTAYYVVVWNLKEPACVILGNSSLQNESLDIYQGLPLDLTRMLWMYLDGLERPNASYFEKMKPMRWKMDCQTRKPTKDSGIFAMRHMEEYKSQARGSYKCGLGSESNTQTKLLDRLRAKYAVKILLADCNENRAEVIAEADAFGKLPNQQQKTIINKSFLNREGRFRGEPNIPGHL